jgi:hypothetical protein
VRTLGPALVIALLLSACGGPQPTEGEPATAGDPVATAGEVRFSLPTRHRVVVEHREGGAWGSPTLVFEDDDRECGAIRAIAAGTTVAATLECDEHYAEDQAPTASVALASSDSRTWSHRDLEGEAYGTPGLSPDGSHAVWAQDGDLRTWSDGEFGTVPAPSSQTQVLTVDDSGDLVLITTGRSAGRCTVEVSGAEQASVPIAPARLLQCSELAVGLESPTEVRGNASGQEGTEFVVRRVGATGWELAAPPPITTPGLDVYPDDPARAIWNQVTMNERGDLVAVGSPDRQHLTAQRYDDVRHRWTPSRVVHDAGAPVCRRRIDDAGLLAGRVFRLRLFCGGEPVVLRSRDGRSWTS